MQSFIPAFNHYWVQFQQQLEQHDQIDPHLAQQIYTQLEHAYCEPQRAYHTVQHIVECLDLFHQVKAQLNDPLAVELAIWFHDVVYEPQAADNEQQSVAFMHRYCSAVIAPAVLEKVSTWIEATQQHLPSSDADLNALLDIDLAILGSSTDRFAQYEQQIHQEYHWVDPSIYKNKRAAVLASFYAMPRLYQTSYFKSHFEQQAKQNLSQALSKI